MKVLRQLCAITVLTLVFAQFAAAEEGVIHPGITPPPPPPTINEPIPYDDSAPGTEPVNEGGTTDQVTELALTLVRNLLALF